MPSSLDFDKLQNAGNSNSGGNVDRINYYLNLLSQRAGGQTPQNTWANRISQYNQQQQQQDKRDQNNQPYQHALFNGNRNDGREDNTPYRELSGIEKFAAAADRAVNNAMSAVGADLWQKNREKYGDTDPRTLLSFVPQIPAGIASAFPSAAAKYTEAGVGKNIQENYEDEQGRVFAKDYDLTAEQRLANVADATIDTVGLFTGGTGQLLAGMSNVNKARRALKSGETGFKESKYFSGSKFFDSTKGQVAFDVAEEAGEEFAQSLLEDVRFDQLDEGSFGRATDSAFWGAVGGLGASGAGHALNAAARGMTNKVVGSLADRQGKAEAQSTERDDGGDPKYTPSFAKGHITPTVKEQLKKEASENNREPGSTNPKVATRGRSNRQDMNGTTAGVLIIQDAWRNGGESAKAIEAAFGIEPEEAQRIFGFNQDGTDRTSELEKVTELRGYIAKKKEQGERVHVAVGRNPDTNGIGAYLAYIDDVSVGRIVDLDKAAYQLLKGDMDGDTILFSFAGPHLQAAKKSGYLIRKLLGRKTVGDRQGYSNLDYDYETFTTDYKRVKEILNPLFDKYNVSNDDRKKLRVQFHQALKMSGNQRNTALSEFFNDLVATANKESDAAFNSAKEAAKDDTNAMNEAYKNRRMIQESIDIDVGNVFSMLQPETEVDMAIAQLIEQGHVEEEALADYCEDLWNSLRPQTVTGDHPTFEEVFGSERKGNIGIRRFAAQIFPLTGMITSVEQGKKGAPLFRGGGQSTVFTVKGGEEMFMDLRMIDPEIGFSKFFALLMGIRGHGKHPTQIITGLFKDKVAFGALREFSVQRGTSFIGSADDFNQFLYIFKDLYNEYVGHVKNAMRDHGLTKETMQIYGVNVPSEIEGESDFKNKDLMRKFFELFENVYCDNLFTDPGVYENYTLDAMAIDVARNSLNSNVFPNMPGMGPVVDQIVQARYSRRKAVQQSVMTGVENLLPQLHVVTQHMYTDENGNIKVEDDYLAMALDIAEHYHSILPEGCAAFFVDLNNRGIAAVEDFLNSEYGKELFKYTDGSTMDINRISWTLGAMSIRYQYSDVFAYYEKFKKTDDISEKQAIINDIVKMMANKKYRSEFHNYLLERVMEYSDDPASFNIKVLESMTSIDGTITLAEKLNEVDDLRTITGDRYDSDGTYPLLVDMLMSDNGGLSLSSLSSRLQRASKATVLAAKHNPDVWRADVESVENSYENGEYNSGQSSVDIVEIMKTMSLRNNLSTHKRITASFLYDCLNIAKPNAEKAQNTYGQSALFAEVETVEKGSAQTFTNEMMSTHTNVVQLDDFLSNRVLFMNAFWGIESYLVDTGENEIVVVSQETMYQSVLGENTVLKNGRPSTKQLFAFLKAKPQVASMMVPDSTSTITVSTDQINRTDADQRFREAVADEVKRSKDAEQYAEDRIKFIIRSRLSKDPRFYGAIPYFMKDINEITGEFANLEYAREVYKAYDAFVDFFYLGVTADMNSELGQSIRRTISQLGFSTTFDSLTDLVEMVSEENTRNLYSSAANISNVIKAAKSAASTSYAADFDAFLDTVGLAKGAGDTKAGNAFDLTREEIRNLQKTIINETKKQNELMLDLMVLSLAATDINEDTRITVSDNMESRVDDLLESLLTDDNAQTVSDTLGETVTVEDLKTMFAEKKKELKDKHTKGDMFILDRLVNLDCFIIQDVKNMDKDKFLKVIDNINETYRLKLTDDEEKADINDIFSIKDDEARIKKLIEKANYYNNMVSARIIGQLMAGTQLGLSVNAYQEASIYTNFFVDSIADLKTAVYDELGEYQVNTSSANKRMYEKRLREISPKFHVGANAFVSNRAVMNSASSGASTIVARNGEAQKIIGILSLLGNRSSCNVPPETYNTTDLELDPKTKKYNIPDGANFLDPETGKLRPLNVYTRQELLDNSDKYPTVQVYISNKCGNGDCKNHGQYDYAYMGGDVSSLKKIVTILTNETMEDLALRLKKSMETAISVIQKVNKQDGLHPLGNVITVTGSNQDEIVKNITSEMKEYQGRLATALRQTLKDNEIGKLFDEEDMITLAQFCCSTFVGRHSSGGQIVYTIDQLYTDKIQDIANAENPVLEFYPLPMSISQICDHIIQDVTPAIYTYRYNNGTMMPENELNRLARESLMDWSKTRVTTNARKVVDKLAPRNIGTSVMIRRTDARTPEQSFFGDSLEDLNSKKSRAKGSRNGKWSNEQLRVINDVTKDIVGEKSARLANIKITKAFFSDRSISRRSQDQVYTRIEALSKEPWADERDSHGIYNEVVIVHTDSIEVFKQAIKYASDNNKNLLATKVTMDSVGNDFIKDSKDFEYGDNVGDAGEDVKERQLTMFNLSNQYINDGIKGNYLESETKQRDPAQIFMRYIDVDGTWVYMGDSASFLNPRKQVSHMIKEDYEFELSNMFDGEIGAITVINKEDLEKITPNNVSKDGEVVSKINVDYSYYTKGRWNDDNIGLLINSVENYIKNITDQSKLSSSSSDYNSDFIKNKRISPLECIGLVKNISPKTGKVTYAPIIIDKSAPKLIDSATVTISKDNKLVIGVEQSVDLSPGDTIKYLTATFGEAFKTNAYIPPMDFLFPDFDVPAFGLDSGLMVVDTIEDGISQEGRWSQLEDILLKADLWYASRKFGVSLFYRYEGGKLVRNSDLLRINSSQLDAEWEQFVDGNEDVWEKFLGGIYHFSEDDEVDMLMRNVARASKLAGIGYDKVFSGLRINNKGESVLTGWDCEHGMLFAGMNADDVLKVFNCINPKFCPKGMNADPRGCLFDGDGKILVNTPNGPKRRLVRFSPLEFSGEETATGSQPEDASYGMQQYGVNSMLLDVVPKDKYQFFMYLGAQAGITEQYAIDHNEQYLHYKENKYDPYEAAPYLSRLDNAPEGYNSREDRKYRSACFDSVKKSTIGITILEEKGRKNTAEENENIRGILDSTKIELGYRSMSDEDLLHIVQMCIGRTFVKNYENDDSRDFIYTRELQAITDYIKQSFKTGLPVKGGIFPRGKMDGGKERYMIPLFEKSVIDRLWDNSEKLRGKFDSKEKFIEAQIKELQQTMDDLYNSDNKKSKKRSIGFIIDGLLMQHGHKVEPGNRMVVFNDFDPLANKKAAAKFDSAQDTNNLVERMEKLDEIGKAYELERREKLKEGKRATANQSGDRATTTLSTRKPDADKQFSILQRLVQIARMNAIFNPFVLEGNITARAASSGTMNFLMKHVDNPVVGLVYEPGFEIPSDILDAVASDRSTQELVIALRTASFMGFREELLEHIDSYDRMKAFMNEKLGSKGWDAICNKVFDVASGGRVFAKTMTKNFIMRFAQRVGMQNENYNESLGIPIEDLTALRDYWGEVQPNGNTLIVDMLSRTNGGAEFVAEVFGRNNMASRTLALQSFNWALRGDMAQLNVVTALYSAWVERNGGTGKAVDFLVCTCVSKFMNYTTNLSGRFLKYVAPVSSINYLAIEMAKDTELGKAAGLVGVHTNASLKEAIMADITSMGFGVVASLLVAISGALQPPDDEDKWVNVEEWTLFGFRIGETWWMQDVLGPALPMACTMSSLTHGKYKPQILFNGLASVMYNNPLMSAGALVEMVADPLGFFDEKITEDAEKAKKLKGGPSTDTEWIAENANVAALSWLSQFATPSIAKEIYNSKFVQPLEKSYKKVYKRDGYGNYIYKEDGTRDTEYTTQFDAALRKLCRRNPFAALLVSSMAGDDSYMAYNMPNVTYPDPYQLYSAKQYSLKDENGNERSEQEQQQIVIEILTTLMSTDDMGKLAKQGFYIPSETRALCSKVIYDAIAKIDEEWNKMNANGELDYYVLGDGDWKAGKEIFYTMLQMKNDDKAFFSSLYYDKLNSSEMKTPMTYYNRRSTNYLQDDNGEFYASGFERDLPLLFNTGQGSVYDKGSTMGKEGDWATASAVTGLTTGERALIPVNQNIEKTPSLESWADDGENGSKLTNGKNNASSSSSGSNNNGSNSNGSNNNKKSSGRRYGRRRSGGGGGGGSTPNIYSRVSRLNISSPRTMNTSKAYHPNFDYLRPDWETKGSRSANRRSDI